MHETILILVMLSSIAVEYVRRGRNGRIGENALSLLETEMILHFPSSDHSVASLGAEGC